MKKIIAVVGLPTTGKSTLGRALSQKTGWHFVDIDDGPAHCAPQPEPEPYRSAEGLARDRARMTVAYATLHAAVEANLLQGFSHIVAATYSRHANQDLLQAAATRGGGELVVVRCTYQDSMDEVSRRVKDRLMRGATGGCRSTLHYFGDKAKYEGIKLPHLVVEMEGGEQGIHQVVGSVLAYASIKL